MKKYKRNLENEVLKKHLNQDSIRLKANNTWKATLKRCGSERINITKMMIETVLKARGKR